VMDKYVGESQKFVGELFEAAQSLAPTVVFIDEIDSITGDRGGNETVTDQVVNQLLLELDGLDELSDVVVIGATNRPDIIDDALLRPGRLGREVHVPSPDEAAKREIFEIHMSNRPVGENVTVDWLVENSGTDISGAEIAAICETAARSAMRRELDDGADGSMSPAAAEMQIRKRDFDRAFEEYENRPEAGDPTGFR